jgi:hypothetical protein
MKRPLAADLAHDFGGLLGQGMHGDMPLQLVEERAPVLESRISPRRAGPMALDGP